MALNPKQKLFAAEYLKDRNGAAAYRRAGYSSVNSHAASAGAARLLANVSIKAAIDEALAAHVEAVKDEARVDAAYVVARLRSVVEQAMRPEPVLDRKGNETGMYTFQAMAAIGALKLIGMHLGMFPKDGRKPRGDDKPQPETVSGILARLREALDQRRRANGATGPPDAAANN